MSDYDIVIKLDPGQPVAGAKAVTDGVVKIENQGKKAQAAMDGVASSAKSLKSIDFKQAAAGGAQIFQLLNEKLKITDGTIGSAIGSAVKFGAAGAQVAGPWGAAIGAIGGALVDLTVKFGTALDEARAFVETKEMMDAWAASIAYGASEVHRLTQGFEALHKALDGLATARALATTAPGLIALGQYNEEIKRQKDLLEKIQGPQRDYHANVDSLNAMLNLGTITSTQFNNAITDLNNGHEAGAAAARDQADALRELAEARNIAVPRAPVTNVVTGEKDNSYLKFGPGEKAQESPDVPFFNTKTTEESIQKTYEMQMKLTEETAKWNAELKAANDNTAVIADQLKSASTTLSDSLVDAANGAEVSWGSLFNSILVGFEKAIVQALILKALTGSADGSKGAAIGGSYAGLFGLMGFASGVVIAPSGSGTTDTQTMMFRKAPSETVRIQTPAQEAAYRTGSGDGGSGAQAVNVVLEDRRDPRALLKHPDFERAVLDVNRRYGQR